MRDYDPTTGRYIQADPLGLVDGASVYGYAGQNPGRYVDPRGLFTIADAKNSLTAAGIVGKGLFGTYSPEQLWQEWLNLERADLCWLEEVPACLKNIFDADPDKWTPAKPVSQFFHGGGGLEIRSKNPTAGGHGAQCVYDENGKLMTTQPAAGSADYVNPGVSPADHHWHDVHPWLLANSIGKNAVAEYFSVRPAK